jgi:hypothetical protein
MRMITVEVPDLVHQDFQHLARTTNRDVAELIREAKEAYRQQHMQRRTSLRDRRPVSVGGPVRPITSEDDILGKVLHGTGD